MFDSKSHKANLPGRKNVPMQPDSLYPILSADDLLADVDTAVKVDHLFERIRDCHVDQKDIDALYKTVVNTVVELLQVLPETEDGYYSRPKGMLYVALDTASEALAMHRSPELIAKTPQIVARRQAVWTYAVFTAALFNGLRELVRRLVSICDKNGSPIEMWMPFEGPMTQLKISEGTHYRYSFAQAYWPTIYRQGVVPLVLEHLLPPGALQWLASDPWIFNYWLAVLCQEASTGTLGNVIALARDHVLSRELANLKEAGLVPAREQLADKDVVVTSTKENEKFKDKTHDRKIGKLGDPRAGNLRNRRIGASGFHGVTAGDVFLAWLREGLVDGSIQVNHKDAKAAGAHVVKEGVLLTGNLLQQFAKEDGRFTSQQVAKQLAERGLMHQSEGSSQQVNYFVGHPSQKQIVAGVLLTDPTTVFNNVPKVNADVATPQTNLSNANLPMMQNEQRLLSKLRVPEQRGHARVGSSIPPLLKG